MATFTSTVRFPGETKEYREARDRLLVAERDLRRQVEQVAEMRRKLPPGGKIPQNYTFREGAPDLGDKTTVRDVTLTDLFRPGMNTLVLYSFMYGPDAKQPCSSCTSILDSLDGAAPHLQQRINLAVVAKSPIERIREFARTRGWRHLRLLSSAGTTYNHDYFGEDKDSSQMPSLNVFVRQDGDVRHFYHSELLFAPSDPGQDARHVDLLWPLWNVFDLTPDGRDAAWHPRLVYDKR